jgi:hypothetical protein
MVFGAACATVLVLSTAAFSQRRAPPCGTMQEAEGELAEFTKYFREEEYAAYRESIMRRLTAEDSQEVVRDPATCKAVLNAALTALRTYSSWAEVEQRGYDFTVLRYGPYYAVLVKVSDDKVSGPPPFDLLLIFREDGLSHILTIQVRG